MVNFYIYYKKYIYIHSDGTIQGLIYIYIYILVCILTKRIFNSSSEIYIFGPPFPKNLQINPRNPTNR